MSKEAIKKLTLADFIRRKEQAEAAVKKTQTAELYIKSLGGTITVQEPSTERILDARDLEEDGDAYIVYHCCVDPNLKADELSDGGVPHEIVKKIFKPGEIGNIARQLMNMAGFSDDSVTVADKLKN